MFSPELNMKNYLMDEIPTCRVPQLMSVLLKELLSRQFILNTLSCRNITPSVQLFPPQAVLDKVSHYVRLSSHCRSFRR